MGRHIRIWALVAGFLMSACEASTNFDTYSNAIGNFATATEQTSVVAARYILTLNEYERGLVYAALEGDPKRKINIVQDLLKPAIDPRAIQMRAQAFDVLKRYTNTLAALAGSDASERWKVEAKKLGTAAATLRDTLEGPANAKFLANSAVKGILGADAATGPLAQIVGALGQQFIDRARARALDQTIVKYRPVIEQLSGLLREDFDFVFKRRRFNALLALHPLNEAYNAAVEAKKNNERLKILKQIKAAVATYEAKVAQIQEVQSAIDRFDAAHAQLVAYARSAKGPADLVALLGEIERYAALTALLFNAIKPPQPATGSAS